MTPQLTPRAFLVARERGIPTRHEDQLAAGAVRGIADLVDNEAGCGQVGHDRLPVAEA